MINIKESFNQASRNEKLDMIEKYYTPIHMHSIGSALDGMIKIKDVVDYFPQSAAITDHGNMYMALEFQKAMDKAGKKAILGTEFYMESIFHVNKNKNDEFLSAITQAGTDDDELNMLQGQHLIVLAKNDKGLKNLLALVDLAETNKYKKPHIKFEWLKEHSEGLIVTSACIGGPIAQTYFADEEKAEEIALMFKDVFEDDFYLEVQNHNIDLELQYNEFLVELSNKHGFKLVCAADSHYTNKEDAKLHELYLAAQVKKLMNDEKRWVFPGSDYHLLAKEEILDKFDIYPDAIMNTYEIAQKCNARFSINGKDVSQNKYYLPIFPIPSELGQDDFTYLNNQVNEAFFKLDIEDDKLAEYEERLHMELETIKSMGFSSYFLVVADYINWAKDAQAGENFEKYFPKEFYDFTNLKNPKSEDDKALADILQMVKSKDYVIPVGPGRGSAAGSLVAYCLGITDVDPIKHDLLFERFLNPDRISMPDVDTDFARDLREEVIDYTRLKYGIDKVGRIITYSQIKAKSGLKMYLRTLGINMSLQTKISEFITADESLKSFIDEDSKFYNALLVEAMEDNSEINKELKTQYQKNDIPNAFRKTLKEVVDDVIKLENNIIAIGQHACGVVISSKPLKELMPTIQFKNPKYDKYDLGVQFAKEEVEEIGCLKMDFLGLKTLDILQNTLNRINKKSGKNLTLNDLNIYDKKIYKILANQESFGVFQFEGEGMIGFLSKYLNKNKEAKTGEKMFDVAAASTAAYRPGPMSELPDFLKSLDEKKWHYPNKYWQDNQAYNEILAPTDGLLLYQEQTMRIVREIAGFTPGEADDFRKVVGKKLVDKIPVVKAKFIEQGMNLGHPENALKDLWNNMEAFASYGLIQIAPLHSNM